MKLRRRSLTLHWLLPVLLLLGLGACASTGAGGPGGQGSTTLRVDNDLVPSTDLRIYLAAATGGRTMVGSVNPGQNATLRFDPVGGGGTYQFIAEIPLGQSIRSNPITFSPGDTIEWDLSANIATVAAPD